MGNKSKPAFIHPVKSIATLSALLAISTQTQALVTYTDSDFPTTSGINASSDNVDIVTTSDVTTPQINMGSGTALLTNGGYTLNVNSSGIFSIQSNATGGLGAFYGVHAVNGTLLSHSNLEIKMVDGRGIYLANRGSATFDKTVTIDSTGTAIGVMAYSTHTTNGGEGFFKDELKINSSGANSYGIVIQNGNPTGDGPELFFDKNVTIRMNGNNSFGIETQDIAPGETLTSSLMHFKNGLDVETADGVAINSRLPNSVVQVDGTSRIVSRNKTYNAIETTAGTINITGKTDIQGNIETLNMKGEAIVNLNLQSGSLVTGKMDNYTQATIPAGSSSGEIHVNFQGGASTWDMSGQGASYINTLSGTGGTLKMSANVATQTGDQLFITDAGGATGNHRVFVLNDGTQQTKGTETFTIITTNGGNGQFTSSGEIELGGYLYGVRQKNGTTEMEVYALNNSTNPGNSGNSGNSGNPGNSNQNGGAITSTANAAASMVNTGYLISYVDTQTLLQRMGQLRNATQNRGDLWIRGFTGDLSSFGSGKLKGFSMNYDGIQAGLDKKIDHPSGNVYIGVMAGYTHGKTKFDNSPGGSTIKSTHAGIYSTYFHEDTGIYVDAMAKYVHMKHNFSVLNSTNQQINGDGKTNGYSLSIEAGKRFTLFTNTPFYLEPQVQLTYSHQNGTNILASNGLRVKLDKYNSLLGRASLIWGYQIESEKSPTNIYMKTGYVHEFRDQTAYWLNTSREQNDLGGSWLDLGFGVSATFNKNHHVYGEFDFSKGARFDRKQINMGYRFEF